MYLGMGDVKGIPRRERAARTRRAIVRAAAEEFRTRGYHGTTMAAIADRAGVAVQTVYFVFHTKALLLTATIDDAVMGEDQPTPPEETDWWQEGATTDDGRRALDLFVTNVAAIERRAAALNRVAHAAATTDPEVLDVLARHESMRVAGFRRYVDTLADLTEARGWSVEKYVAWTVDALCRLLLKSR
jgi:AcrR family transcriptional regulator